ncbi:MAG TPA: hypothetical protein VHB27_13155 [Rhodopila sp.]|jgi:hypothetical protein|uniref:glycosyltransferase n=1 Tax=Rhodopila sp. TaxID=2480087 RepID=UPI002BED43CE|nr:hypothetical protein [Rhodopila sp.]HVY16166.1 hypothetical protein [Rhodopila sp.]
MPRFNFVVGRDADTLSRLASIQDLAGLVDADPAEAAAIFADGELVWCLQTYILLANRGALSVSCTNALDDGCVNIVHSDRLLNIRGRPSAFVVCARADYPKRHWAQHHIVQNRTQAGPAASYIPHWVQPGLRKRDPRRRGVLRVGYAGQISRNLAGGVAEWEALFRPHGIEFVLLPKEAWHDLRAIDVLVGVRSFDGRPHDTKPPSKLFNAWHAEIPFIGGADSAFRQVGMPGRDYIAVRTKQEALDAVLMLRDDPARYRDMVESGKRRARTYCNARIAETWERVLTEDVARRYWRWCRAAGRERALFHAMQSFGLGLHGAKQIVKRLA